jgi:hypothetical protein
VRSIADYYNIAVKQVRHTVRDTRDAHVLRYDAAEWAGSLVDKHHLHELQRDPERPLTMVEVAQFVMRPARAAFNKPGRRASFLLIRKVAMQGGHFY